ncbi:MAG: LysR family transcriptional regulator [Clostridia bacterium]|nr:LysR family transcriptional regulator [Clostridia bacterium]MBQ7043458.1 LysR family transcriptional regulator [Clostridia bacterium]
MDSSKFYALLKAVEHGSLTKAAEELGYTQAGLTHMMNRLEKEIGLTLLQRNKSGVTLTADGTELFPLIKQFTQAGLTLDNAINSLKSGNDKLLRIYAYASIASHWLPVIISNFKKDYPNISFEIQVAGYDEIAQAVESGDADLGFTSHQPAIHGDWIPLAEDPLYAVLPVEADNNQKSVPISILNNKSFFMPTYGLDYDIMHTLEKNNVHPLINRTALDDSAVVSMVSHSLGYSILPKLVLKGMHGRFTAKEIEPKTHRELGILIKSKNSLSPVAHKFITCSKQTVREIR